LDNEEEKHPALISAKTEFQGSVSQKRFPHLNIFVYQKADALVLKCHEFPVKFEKQTKTSGGKHKAICIGWLKVGANLTPSQREVK
jgi:hypothetical protein